MENLLVDAAAFACFRILEWNSAFVRVMTMLTQGKMYSVDELKYRRCTYRAFGSNHSWTDLNLLRQRMPVLKPHIAITVLESDLTRRLSPEED